MPLSDRRLPHFLRVHASYSRGRRRRLSLETLERRQLLAADLAASLAFPVPGLYSSGEGEAASMHIALDQRLVFHSFPGSEGPFGAKLYSIAPHEARSGGTPILDGNSLDSLAGQDPDWSPDGSHLVFSQPGSNELWVLNSFTGKKLPVLTRSGESVIGVAPVWVGDLNRTISWVESTVDSEVGNTNWDIFYCGLDFFEDRVEFAHVPLNATDHPANDFHPSWSADGSKLVFQSDRSGAGDIYLMDFYAHHGDTLPEAVSLTANRGLAGDFNPEISPDGTKIVFVSTSGNSDIWVMNIDGSEQTQLTFEPQSDLAPTWSPDGTQIAFQSFVPGDDGLPDPEIYVINADGSGRTLITNNDRFDTAPTWRREAQPPSDLAVFINSPQRQRDDEEFEVLVTVVNLGIVSSTDVLLKIELDDGLEIKSADAPSGMQLDVSDNLALLRIPSMVSSSSITLPLQIRAYDPGYPRIHAEAFASPDIDNFHDNNRAAETVEITPRNDNFADAFTISGAVGNIETSNLLASSETAIFGEPEPAHAGGTGGPVAGGSSIWYRWFAPDDGLVTFNTHGSPVDTLLAAYFVTNVNDSRLVQVAANDDAAGRTSQIQFQASKGADYYIAIDGYRGAQGQILLNWSQKADIKPVPVPQRIQSLSTTSVIRGSGDLQLTLHGSGFSGASRVYVYEAGEQIGSRQSRNFVQATFRGHDSKLEATIPARFFTTDTTLRIVAVRGSTESNIGELHVTSRVTLPVGSDIELGQLRITADRIVQSLEGGEGENHTENFEVGGHVAINEYLAVEGATIKLRIDRAANSLNLRIQNGRIVLTNFPGYGNVTLWSGNDFEFNLDGQGALTDLLRARIETPLRDRGIDISITRGRLLLGNDRDAQNRPIYGIEIEGHMKFGQVFGLVDVPIQFSNLVMTQNAGVRFATEIGPLNMGIPKLFGLEDVFLSYQPGASPDQDVFVGRGTVVTGLGLKAGGSIEIRGGALNSVEGNLEVPPAVGVPIGPINITGGTLGVENLLRFSALKIKIGASISLFNPVVANVIGINRADLFYQLPASFGGSGSLQIFRANVAGVDLSFDIPGGVYTFGGSVTLLPNFEFFFARGELSASINDEGTQISGFLEGGLQIPDGNGGIYDIVKSCVDLGVIKLGPCVKFPIVIANAKMSYRNGTFKVETHFPIVEKATLTIKRTGGAIEASISVFENFKPFQTRFRFGGAGEGEDLLNTIGDLTVPPDTPRLIVSASGASAAPAYDLIAPDGTRITAETASLFGGTYFYNPETHDSVYVIESPQAGLWIAEAHLTTTDVVSLEAWGVNEPPELTDLQVVPAADGTHQISYQAFDPDDDALVSLYYTTSPELTNGQLIVEGLPESSAGTFTWSPQDGSVASGTYYIYAMAEDELNAPAVLFAPTPITIADPLAPATPQGLTVTPGAENTLSVSWTPSTEDDLAGYQIWYGLANADGLLDQRIDVSLETTYLIKGLDSNQAYRVAIVAYDANEEPNPFAPDTLQTRNRFSLPSDAITETTGFATPPVFYFASHESDKMTSGTDRLLEWFILGEDIESQQLFVSRDAGDTYQLVVQLPPDARSYAWRASAVDAGVPNLHFRLEVLDTSGNRVVETTESFSTLPAGVVELSDVELIVHEGELFATLLVRRRDGSAGEVTVQFATTSLSANAANAANAADYESLYGQLYFADGETEQLLRIPIVDDSLVEADETFQVTLYLPQGGILLGDNRTALVTIVSDDVITDSDEDGVLDSVENLAPGGDGNADGVPDSEQAHVVSLFVQGYGFTLIADANLTWRDVRWVTPPDAYPLPDFMTAAGSSLAATLVGLPVAATTMIEVIPHERTADTFLVRGRASWDLLPASATSGVRTLENRFLVTLTDGGAGDTDGAGNGQLSFQALIGASTQNAKNQNPVLSLDVNGDGIISALDILLIINDLNQEGARPLLSQPVPRGPQYLFLDTSGDNIVSALDVLLIVNALDSGGEGESNFSSRWPVPIENSPRPDLERSLRPTVTHTTRVVPTIEKDRTTSDSLPNFPSSMSVIDSLYARLADQPDVESAETDRLFDSLSPWSTADAYFTQDGMNAVTRKLKSVRG